MLEIVVPAHNEEAIIADSILKLEKVLGSSGIDYSLTVVSNGSEDDTVKQCQMTNDECQIKVGIIEMAEKGKGRAIKTAADKSVAEVFGFIDADLSADPEVIPNFVELIEQGRADMAIGSRLLREETTERGYWRGLSSQIFNFFARSVLGLKYKDTQCGLKVMNRRAVEVLKACKEDGWFLDIELLARAEEAGLRVVERPVEWVEVRYPGRKSKLNHIKDGGASLAAMFRIKGRLRDGRAQRKIQS